MRMPGALLLGLGLLLQLLLALGNADLAQAQGTAEPLVEKVMVCPDCTFITVPMANCSRVGNVTIPAKEDAAGWNDFSMSMATCICPTFKSVDASRCLACISTDFAGPSRTLMQKLVSDCFADNLDNVAATLTNEVYNVDVANVVAPTRPPLADNTKVFEEMEKKKKANAARREAGGGMGALHVLGTLLVALGVSSALYGAMYM